MVVGGGVTGGYPCAAMSDRESRAQQRTVTVRGIGSARVLPEGVIVGLGVQHRADVAAEALSETARKAEQLESLFRELGIDEEDWVAGSISLREQQEWDEVSRREVRNGYIASSRIDVRLGDASRVGTLLAQAAERVEASIDGPRWEIRPENPAHDEARARAIEDSRRRADTYAKPAELQLGDVLAVVEAGAEESGHFIGSYSPTFSAAKALATMPIHSEGLEVAAGVLVTYELVPR
jgi:uncharacterized protein